MRNASIAAKGFLRAMVDPRSNARPIRNGAPREFLETAGQSSTAIGCGRMRTGRPIELAIRLAENQLGAAKLCP